MKGNILRRLNVRSGEREVGLIKRLQQSTLAVIAVMALLSISLLVGGRWMVDVYKTQQVRFEEYANLSDLARGISSYREGVRLLINGNTNQGIAAINVGERYVHERLPELGESKLLTNAQLSHIRQEVMLSENAEEHILGLKSYIDENIDDLVPAELENKNLAMSHFAHDLERQAKGIHEYLLAIRESLRKSMAKTHAEALDNVNLAGTAVLLLAFVVSSFSIALLAHAVRQMMTAFGGLKNVANHLAEGDYSIRLPSAPSAEVRHLFKCFNNMIARLEMHRVAQLKHEESLEFLAHQDSLTGLFNRSKLTRHLQDFHANRRELTKNYAVLFLDIDRFKGINDSLGHQIGDNLIKAFAERVSSCLRSGDVIARLGGDEFAIILHEVDMPDGAALVAQRILNALASPFKINSYAIHITTSIGISHYPKDDVEPTELLRKADLAMFKAKDEGRNCIAFFSEELDRIASDRLFLESALREAIAKNRFILHYQPKVDVRSGEIVGAEALLRWHHPNEGMIGPARFIPILEETVMIDKVGQWVIKEACQWSARNGGIKVAVNVATRQLYDPNFVTYIVNALEQANLPTSSLELEITESLLMENTETVKGNLNKLNEMGISLALDDFGTGYSSLSYLQYCCANVLKLDRSFILGIRDIGASVVAGVVSMAHGLNMIVVAEGVETMEEFLSLQALDCDQIQGYLFAKPMPEDEFIDFVREYRVLPEIFCPSGGDEESWQADQTGRIA